MGNYRLISKSIGQDFAQYNKNAIRLNFRTPKTVDEVVVGLKDNPSLQRKITTFRDEKGQIMERAFDYHDKPYRNRLYSHQDNVIGSDEYVNSTTIREYTLSRRRINEYKDNIELYDFLQRDPIVFWNKQKTQTNHLSENVNTGEKILSKVTVNELGYKEQHQFVEYPKIGSKDKTPTKELEFNVNNDSRRINPKSIKTNNTQIPKHDKFLSMRALDLDAAKTKLAEHYIRERNLEHTDIIINKDYRPLRDEKNLIAFYSDDNGSINFSREYNIKSKARIAETTSHEIEHAWQWYLDARNAGGRTQYTQKIAKQEGKIKDKKLLEEAKQYTNAIDNYVPFYKNFKEYRKNLTEKIAYEKGYKEMANYISQGKEIQTEFPHIPKELL